MPDDAPHPTHGNHDERSEGGVVSRISKREQAAYRRRPWRVEVLQANGRWAHIANYRWERNANDRANQQLAEYPGTNVRVRKHDYEGTA